MKKRIWKFLLSNHGETAIESRKYATIISTGLDASGFLSVWMSVDPEKPKKAYRFKTVFTGEEMPSDLMFMATVAQPKSGLVYHIFRE